MSKWYQNMLAAGLLATALSAQGEEVIKPQKVQRGTAEPVAADFQSAPSEYRPHGWFFWVDGHITKNGLTKDLEAMKAAGLGGGAIFDVGQGGPVGPVGFCDETWRGMVQHTFTEAERLDLQFGMHNCGGWSCSGGAWVPVEDSMKRLGWTTTLLEGPGRASGPLPKMPVLQDYYRDVAVLAYPEVKGGSDILHRCRSGVRASADGAELDLEPLLDNDFRTAAGGDNWRSIQVDLPEEVVLCSVLVAMAGGQTLVISSLDPSGNSRPVGELKLPGAAGKTFFDASVNYTPVTARSFRIERKGNATGKIAELRLGAAPMISCPTMKAGFIPCHRDANETAAAPGLPHVPSPGEVIDLTAKLRADGTLDWEAPPGTWTIYRFGMTVTGEGPHPSRGRNELECDKLDAGSMRRHLEKYIGVIAAEAGSLAGKRFTYSEIDSYEKSCPNWTGTMPEKFRDRRGYEIGPWLVALAGRPVGSIEETERYLWDFRRTVADEFWGTFRTFLNERGMFAYGETYGHIPGDETQCSGRVDVPMAECWWREREVINQSAKCTMQSGSLLSKTSVTAGLGN